MAKVLLIAPNQDILKKEANKRVDSPLNLIFLATFIKDKHQVKIYDRNIYPNDEDFKNFFLNYSPDIVGITSMTSLMLHDLIHIGKLVKALNKNVTTIVGGTHATIEPKSLLNEPYVDFVLRGEGEEAFLEFCDTFDRDKAKLKKLKNINLNPLRPLMNLDDIKLPDYSFIELEKYEHFYVTLSRGCIGNCTFCSNHKMWGKDDHPFVRMFSSEKAIQLFNLLIHKYKIKNFSLMDDNFVTFRSRVKEICNYLQGKDMNFFCFGRADCLDDEMVQYLKKAGCHTVQIGIESGSQRILDFLCKKTTVKQNADAIRCVERNGLTCDPSVMVGVPTETAEDLNRTFELIRRTKPSCTDAQIFNPMPGTPIFEYCLEKKLITKPKTLEEWANWTGDWTLEAGVNHNVSAVSDKYLLEITKEIRDYRILQNKIKRFLFWVKKGDVRQAIQSSILFFKRRILRYSEYSS
ncbi:tRNA-2-methylthio-N(6)-dimethylallyladenosine synthase [uncultured archaeon]|nr:tRNA-2-methylthio-N(6)-dimethylallyladenosine synthase [uncultured archaeon]